MAHARVVGAIEGSREPHRRRGPDADRASLADDVPPALLARQRHRPRAPRSAGSTSPCGTSSARCTACRATGSGAGRCAITSASTATSAAARWKILRDRRRRARFARPGAASGRRRLHGVQVDGRAADDADRRPAPDPTGGEHAWRRCARPSATTSTSWSTATRGRPRAWGFGSPRRSSRTACTSSKSRAGRRRVEDLAAIQRAVTTPIATGERLIGLARVPRPVRGPGLQRLQPDITHCGGLTEARRIAALAEALPRRAGPAQSAGPVSTAASLEFGFATPSYIICETVHRRCSVARRRRSANASVEPKADARPAERPPRPGHRDRRGRRPASLPAGVLQRVFYQDGSVGDW